MRALYRYPLKRWPRSCTAIFAILLLLPLSATPPEYPTFRREQRTDYSPKAENLLRIWVVYVDQGDGIVIQLPSKYKTDNSGERIDVLIDGGSNPKEEGKRISRFLSALYPNSDPTIEYAVISHHDQDHVAGLTQLLADPTVTFQNIYHSGAASYRAGVRGFPATGKPATPSVVDFQDGKISRGMAYLKPNSRLMQDSYLITDLDMLKARQDEFQGVYEALADAVIKAHRDHRVARFDRAFAGAPFINEAQTARGAPLAGISFEVLWPQTELEAYGTGNGGTGSGNWGETINGNSVTFKLTYGDFEMLFTGDHNEKSEESFMEELKQQDKLGVLSCDVLKVPHHGSAHAFENFFKAPELAPVISVASMGEQGFKSKAMGNSGAWQHPDTDVIDWLGGPHRFYSTFIHEKRFAYAAITTAAKREAMIEKSHVLIETDGQWFRVVEVPVDAADYTTVPSVEETKRSNGTRWIKAKP